jgi:uncharacterized protein (TIGR03435 family)
MKPCCFAIILGFCMSARPQSSPQQTEKLEYEVAAIRQSKSEATPYTNFPLGPGPEYTPGGRLIAKNMPLLKFIEFAYKPTNYQIESLRSQMPSWSRDIGFDIEARAEGNPSKDEMRLMMQSLLATRFHLIIHRESREVPVFALTLVKPGKTGPQLRPHTADDPTCVAAPLPKNAADGNPAVCGASTVIPASAPNLFAIGGHNVSIPMLAVLFPGLHNNVDRPVLDRTGLSGTFDYSLEWAPEFVRPAAPGSNAVDSGPSFIEALKDQLGLKLSSQKGLAEFIVLGHIEHPSEN